MPPTEMSPKLSEDTLSYLADAKKGKIRRFVMVAKGAAIVSLIVYKKGSLEKLKKEAKESGKGHVYYGTVEGSGQSLVFKLSTEDGFTDAPTKTAVLKAFLSDGGHSCKPEFQIVPVLPTLTDDDPESSPNEGNAPTSPETTPDSSTLNPEPNASVNSTETAPETKAAVVDLALWQSRRLQVLQSLKELAKVIAAAKDPDSAAAIIEIKAVIANLTESPSTPQQIAELRRYLVDDDVVADVCDFAFDFRNDLLGALPVQN